MADHHRLISTTCRLSDCHHITLCSLLAIQVADSLCMSIAGVQEPVQAPVEQSAYTHDQEPVQQAAHLDASPLESVGPPAPSRLGLPPLHPPRLHPPRPALAGSNEVGSATYNQSSYSQPSLSGLDLFDLLNQSPEDSHLQPSQSGAPLQTEAAPCSQGLRLQQPRRIPASTYGTTDQLRSGVAGFSVSPEAPPIHVSRPVLRPSAARASNHDQSSFMQPSPSTRVATGSTRPECAESVGAPTPVSVTQARAAQPSQAPCPEPRPELDVEGLQASLDSYLSSKDTIAASMHDDGSIVVGSKDGSHVWLVCNLCGQLPLKEAYTKGRGKSQGQSWPSLSWKNIRQHIKGISHFTKYLNSSNAEEAEAEFIDTLCGKDDHEKTDMIKEEFRARIGGRTRWTNKVLNEGNRKRRPTEQGQSQTEPRPRPRQSVHLARAAALAQQLQEKLNDPQSNMSGWLGSGLAGSHTEVPTKSV
jgi:hypothetical protein